MTTSLILKLVAVLVVVLVASYFVSDVVRGRSILAIDSMTKWTPENIVRHPEAFLAFSEQNTQESLLAIRAAQVRVSQNRGTLETMGEESQARIRAGSDALRTLVPLYREAEQTNGWPVTWRDRSWDRNEMQRQIRSLDREVKRQQALDRQVRDGIRRCDVDMARATDLLQEAHATLEEIRLTRQKLKVEQLSEALTLTLQNVRSSVSAILDHTTSADRLVTAQELADEAALTVDEREFDAILHEWN